MQMVGGWLQTSLKAAPDIPVTGQWPSSCYIPDGAAADFIRKEARKISELSEKVKNSVQRLKAFAPPDGSPYYLAFSGGKDSVVTKAIAQLAGVPFVAYYRITTVDPPELFQFIRTQHPDVIRETPHYKSGPLAGKAITMWNLIPLKMIPPTRMARYCCEFLKEDGGDGGIAVTGVRWAESANRKANQGGVVVHGDFRTDDPDQTSLWGLPDGMEVNQRHGSMVLNTDNAESRQLVEHCFRRRKITVNPIVEWTDADVWEFIKAENIPYCELYHEGFHRLGCIGCPMAGTEQRLRDFERWPKYRAQYLRSFDKMLERRRQRNKQDPSRPVWRTGGTDVTSPTKWDVYRWWMELNDKWDEKKKERGKENAEGEY